MSMLMNYKMEKKKNSKTPHPRPLTVVILEKLVDLARSYSRPLDDYERQLFYKALGPWSKLISTRQYSRKLYQLKEQGFITKSGPKIPINITAKGRQYLEKFKKREIVVSIPKKWDKRWRLIIFDIPESMKLSRNSFRHHIKSLRFEQVQKSVWVYPYSCHREVAALCALYEIGPFVSIFEGTYKGDDSKLRRIFGL